MLPGLPWMVVLASQVDCIDSIGTAAVVRATPRVQEHTYTPVTPALARLLQKPRPLHGVQHFFSDHVEVLLQLASVVGMYGSVCQGEDGGRLSFYW